MAEYKCCSNCKLAKKQISTNSNDSCTVKTSNVSSTDIKQKLNEAINWLTIINRTCTRQSPTQSEFSIPCCSKKSFRCTNSTDISLKFRNSLSKNYVNSTYMPFCGRCLGIVPQQKLISKEKEIAALKTAAKATSSSEIQQKCKRDQCVSCTNLDHVEYFGNSYSIDSERRTFDNATRACEKCFCENDLTLNNHSSSDTACETTDINQECHNAIVSEICICSTDYTMNEENDRQTVKEAEHNKYAPQMKIVPVGFVTQIWKSLDKIQMENSLGCIKSKTALQDSHSKSRANFLKLENGEIADESQKPLFKVVSKMHVDKSNENARNVHIIFASPNVNGFVENESVFGNFESCKDVKWNKSGDNINRQFGSRDEEPNVSIILEILKEKFGDSFLNKLFSNEIENMVTTQLENAINNPREKVFKETRFKQTETISTSIGAVKDLQTITPKDQRPNSEKWIKIGYGSTEDTPQMKSGIPIEQKDDVSWKSSIDTAEEAKLFSCWLFKYCKLSFTQPDLLKHVQEKHPERLVYNNCLTKTQNTQLFHTYFYCYNNIFKGRCSMLEEGSLKFGLTIVAPDEFADNYVLYVDVIHPVQATSILFLRGNCDCYGRYDNLIVVDAEVSAQYCRNGTVTYNMRIAPN